MAMDVFLLGGDRRVVDELHNIWMAREALTQAQFVMRFFYRLTRLAYDMFECIFLAIIHIFHQVHFAEASISQLLQDTHLMGTHLQPA